MLKQYLQADKEGTDRNQCLVWVLRVYEQLLKNGYYSATFVQETRSKSLKRQVDEGLWAEDWSRGTPRGEARLHNVLLMAWFPTPRDA